MLEAMASSEKKQWHKDIKDELKSMEHDATWTKTALPTEKTLIPCMMMFKRNIDDNKSVCRFKACLEAERFFQKEEIDHSKTFAPVVPFEVLLHLMRKLVSDGWHANHADISTVSLDGDIDGELYVS